MKFKERTPVETVDFILNIINKFKWTINEEWLPYSDIGTYSLRITLENAPSIGSNGKGTTREYAKASAYAELLERIQNMRVSPFAQLYHIYKRGQSDFIIFENECI